MYVEWCKPKIRRWIAKRDVKYRTKARQNVCDSSRYVSVRKNHLDDLGNGCDTILIDGG